MEPYGVYGRFYDLTQGSSAAAAYRRLLEKHHPRASSLLELACGTGANLVPLAKHYAVAGLDISRTMLAVAKAKLPGVSLYRQNMAGFKVDRRFDAIVCPYDSINHLLRFSDWKQTFRAANRHLARRGVFIFDVNTERKLQALTDAQPSVLAFGKHRMIMKVSSVGRGIYDWDIQIFQHVRRDLYRLHHEVIKERAYTHDRVLRALEHVFSTVHAYDPQGWSRPKRTSRRLFYVCRSSRG